MSIVRDQSGEPFRIVTSYLDVSDLKRTEAELRQAQKLETVGQLTGGVAHDFNNLLMAMQINLEMVTDRLRDDPEGLDFVQTALASVERGGELTARLLAFSRRQTLQPRTVDPNGLVEDTSKLLRRTLGENIAVRTQVAAHVRPIEIDQGQFENAILNLAVNARDAMVEGGTLTIETLNDVIDNLREDQGSYTPPPGEYVRITVSDTGTGMSEEVMEKAFEPFFTTKGVGKGSGLGLSMVYGFVKQSGGHIALNSQVGGGTIVDLYFPAAGGAVVDRDIRVAAAGLQRGTETVLLVEDDPGVRGTIAKLLTSLGYRVHVSSDGPDAVAAIRDGLDPDLLLADVVLPNGMTGRDVAGVVSSERPNSRVLYMSGYAESAIVHDGRLEPGVVLLSKPFPREALARKIRDVLDAAA